MSFWNDLLGRGKSNPANAAMPYLDQIPGQLHQAMDPYISRGNDQYAALSQAYGDMSDPASFLEKAMAGYQPSRGYQMRQNEALTAASNSAAAGGMRGSSQDQIGQARIADSLMGDDIQQWLQNYMNTQQMGLQGKQRIYDQGFGASQGMADNLANVLGSKAQLGMQGQAQQNRSAQNIFSGMLGMGGMLGGGMLGSAFGPMGTLFGAKIGSGLGQQFSPDKY